MHLSVPENITLSYALRTAAVRNGLQRLALQDSAGQPISYSKLLARIDLAARALRRALQVVPSDTPHAGIGFMLPGAADSVVLLFALSTLNRTTALLNFTAGRAAIDAACAAAQVSCIVTSRRFVEHAKLQPLIDGRSVIYAEDLRALVRLSDLAVVALQNLRAPRLPKRAAPLMLFTSGSEGAPKGVQLAPRALVHNALNCLQSGAVRADDASFNCLPLFHAFGLTGGLLLPLLAGMRTVLHPTPLQYKAIPQLIRASKATIFFSTDTFLNKYAAHASADDFRGLRFVIAGAEKLHETTRTRFLERFGVPVYQGYGVTETAPVLAFNTPDAHKSGSVGRLLPHIEHRLLPVEGRAVGGRLLVRAPSVMDGYRFADAPDVLHPPPDGFHDTGDVVEFDADGFLYILGRAKRFAKIAGEMISLAAVEALAQQAFPEHRHAALALPNASKGERIVLLSEADSLTRATLQQAAADAGVSALHVPAHITPCEALPLTATGKPDYPAMARLLDLN